MFIIDGHLDLSMNAIEWARDLTLPVGEINEKEKHLTDKPDRGKATVSLPELRKGNIGLVVATQIARVTSKTNPLPGFSSPGNAFAHTALQLSWYRAMEALGEMVQIKDLESLQQHVKLWQDDTTNENKPIGYILSLEGADSLVDLDHLHTAWNYGLRALGPAHYGTGQYANGTESSGKMNAKGLDLLKEMEQLNIILDVTHLCDDAFWQALDHFNGPVWASHNNVRALVNHNRQFSDGQILELISRGAVIGGALDAWMMVPHWERGVSTPVGMNVNLEKIIDHIDHICQLAGNTLHVGVGTDLDGAFGREQCPYDLETIADLQKLAGLFSKRGYSNMDIENIMHGNWLRFLYSAWK